MTFSENRFPHSGSRSGDDRDAERHRQPVACPRNANPALTAALAITGDRRGDAGRRLVLSAGAGHPALSALPRAALRLLSGDPARRAGGVRGGQGCAARRAAGRACACWRWPRSAMPGSAPITPASNGSSGRGRPIAPARSAISAAPATCLERLDTVKVVRCDEVQWRFLGLSLAGYNVLISLLMAAIAAWGIARLRRRTA